MNLKFKTLAASAATVMALATVSNATVISAAPADLTDGATEAAAPQVFAELAGVTVAAGDVTVDFLASDLVIGNANGGVSSFSDGAELVAGTFDSFIVHYDPASGSSASGSFTFDGDIVAIILSNGNNAGTATALLNASDAVFGGAGTTYETNLGRRTEGSDSFTLLSSNELAFSFRTNATNVDNIRVITTASVAPVPLPAGGLLLIGGLGALAMQRRRRKAA